MLGKSFQDYSCVHEHAIVLSQCQYARSIISISILWLMDRRTDAVAKTLVPEAERPATDSRLLD